LARKGYTVAELHTRRRNASTSKDFYDPGGLTTRNVGSERECRKAQERRLRRDARICQNSQSGAKASAGAVAGRLISPTSAPTRSAFPMAASVEIFLQLLFSYTTDEVFQWNEFGSKGKRFGLWPFCNQAL
jgi:hypothetical protein